MKILKTLKKELLLDLPKNRGVMLVLLFILALALFVRVFRVDQILGFYYDQGRDALVIWDFIHKGRLFLIGPTTGIEGIFRGPWYYWLITPSYWLGRGNPIWPAVFLSLTTVAAILLLAQMAYVTGGRIAAFTAAIIASFSFQLVVASRWLSNPTPMFLISMLLVYSLFLIIRGKQWAWIAVGGLLGLGMQFGSAAEIFYLPAVLVFTLLHREYIPSKKLLILSLLVLLISFLPQIVFDLKHDGILSTAIKRFLIQDQSFKISFWEVLKLRGKFYFDVFSSKLFPTSPDYRQIFAALFLLGLVLFSKKLFTNRYFLSVFLLFISPLLGMVFFQGNKGNVYDYYFTGYYLIFVLAFSVVLANYAKPWFGKILLVFFLITFLRDNLPIVKRYINSNASSPDAIIFGTQKQALDWIYSDLGECKKFNSDAYVPPVIPYAYTYLFTWYGGEVKKCPPVEERVDLLYTLYEKDPPHPERLGEWLNRQKGIAKVETEKSFGMITSQRRTRIDEK